MKRDIDELSNEERNTEKYASFALPQHEQDYCDFVYKQIMIPHESILCVSITKFFILLCYSILELNKKRSPFKKHGEWNVKDSIPWSRGLGMAILSQTTLSARHLQLYRVTFRLIRIISLPYTSAPLIQEVHKLASLIAELVVELVPGTEHTINFHMINHMADEMERWGPARSYWLFCFECLNRYMRNLIKTHSNPEASCFINFSMELHASSLTTKKGVD